MLKVFESDFLNVFCDNGDNSFAPETPDDHVEILKSENFKTLLGIALPLHFLPGNMPYVTQEGALKLSSGICNVSEIVNLIHYNIPVSREGNYVAPFCGGSKMDFESQKEPEGDKTVIHPIAALPGEFIKLTMREALERANDSGVGFAFMDYNAAMMFSIIGEKGNISGVPIAFVSSGDIESGMTTALRFTDNGIAEIDVPMEDEIIVVPMNLYYHGAPDHVSGDFEETRAFLETLESSDNPQLQSSLEGMSPESLHAMLESLFGE